MPVQVIQNTKGLVLQPRETLEALKESSLTEAFQHYVILLILYTVLAGITSVITTLISFYDMLLQIASVPLVGSFLLPKADLFKPLFINSSFFIIFLIFLAMFFGIFLKGCFFHVFVILFGGERGVVKTIQVLMYGVTPFFLLAWIPYISIIGIIWTCVLCVIGLSIFQNVSIGKALIILFMPIIFMIIGIFLILMMGGALLSVLTGLV